MEMSDAALWLYGIAFGELQRHVATECRERGELLGCMWDHCCSLVELRCALQVGSCPWSYVKVDVLLDSKCKAGAMAITESCKACNCRTNTSCRLCTKAAGRVLWQAVRHCLRGLLCLRCCSCRQKNG